MIPVYGTVPHDPPNSWGDCHRAAIASVLELPVEEVPHFYRRGLDYPQAGLDDCANWLATRGIRMIAIPWFTTLQMALDAGARATGHRGYWLLGGNSTTGCGHTVVCRRNLIVHNPTVGHPKIVAPMEDGAYWTDFFGMLI